MLRALVPLVLPQVVSFTLVFGSVQVLESGLLDRTGIVGGERVGVLWGDRVHATPEELGAWLRERGGTYDVWAKRHPQAAVRLASGEPLLGAAGGPTPLLGERRTLILGIAAFLSASLVTVAILFRRRRRAARAARSIPPAAAPGPAARPPAAAPPGVPPWGGAPSYPSLPPAASSSSVSPTRRRVG